MENNPNNIFFIAPFWATMMWLADVSLALAYFIYYGIIALFLIIEVRLLFHFRFEKEFSPKIVFKVIAFFIIPLVVIFLLLSIVKYLP